MGVFGCHRTVGTVSSGSRMTAALMVILWKTSKRQWKVRGGTRPGGCASTQLATASTYCKATDIWAIRKAERGPVGVSLAEATHIFNSIAAKQTGTAQSHRPAQSKQTGTAQRHRP